MKRRISLLALAAVVCSTVVACGSGSDVVDLGAMGAAANAKAPEPAGVVVNPTAATQPANNCGDPTKSLKPGALPAPGHMPSGSTMDRILKRGRLIAGVDQTTYLFGYLNPANSTIEGFDIDMVRQVAQAIFGNPNKVQFKTITSAERVDALRTGAVDIVVRTFTINCSRLKDVSFSSVYYDAGQRVLVPKSSKVNTIDDLGGKKVCATKASDSLPNLASRPSKPIPVGVDNWSDCLVLLQQGQVDAVSTDDTILAGMAAQDPNLRITGPAFHDEPYGMAVQKGASDFVKFVNAVLVNVRAHSWKASYQKWIGGKLGPVPNPPTPKYTS